MLFIKHHVSLVWRLIELANDIVFTIFYKSILDKALSNSFNGFIRGPFQYRRLTRDDAVILYKLIRNQSSSDLKFFKPHSFDELSILKQTRKKSFLMMGVFNEDELVGYFFLRFFANRKCFVGRLIDKEFRGLGIGEVMNKIMYETAWRMRFRCLSTISRENTAVMKAHGSNKNMIVLKELKNNYLLVEFIPD